MAGSLDPYLGAVCRRLRLACGAKQLDIQTRSGISDSVISDFELGKHAPDRLDDLLEAYAAETGVKVAEIWAEAVADMIRAVGP